MKADARSLSIFLPMGIAFALHGAAFTCEAGAAQWLWQAEPHFGILFGCVGFAFIAVHVIRRRRASQR